MAKFIKVHDRYNNLPVIVNTDNIGAVEYITSEDDQKKSTRIYFVKPLSDQESTYFFIDINETVERLEEMITK